MITGKYEYFESSGLFRVLDGATERYKGNGAWVKCSFDPYKAMSVKSGKWDFGETSRVTSALELKNIMEFIDEAEKGK